MQPSMPQPSTLGHSGPDDDLGRFLAAVASAIAGARRDGSGLPADLDSVSAALAAPAAERVAVVPRVRPACRNQEAARAGKRPVRSPPTIYINAVGTYIAQADRGGTATVTVPRKD